MKDPSLASCVLINQPIQTQGWTWDPISGHGCIASPAWPPETAYSELEIVLPEQAEEIEEPVSSSASTDRRLHMVSASFARIVTEVLDGRRRLSQLESHFESAALGALSARLRRLKGSTVRLASVHVQATSQWSAEVTMRYTTTHLSHAAALRVTNKDGHWICTDLVIG